MAYITAEDVAEIRNDLKKAFPYVKFAVRRQHSTSVNVVILKAPFSFDFSSPRRSYQGKQYFDVNHHWIDRDDEDRQRTATDDDGNSTRLGDHEAYVFLRAVKAIITKKWWDESDVQSDYFNTAFYYDIKVGSWDKPFEKTERPEGLKPLTEKEDLIQEVVDAGNLNGETLDEVADKIQEIFDTEDILEKVTQVINGRGAVTPSMRPLTDAEFRSRFTLVTNK